jgi:hypothetical protein
MTQDYAPIELNENTPEPKEKHSYYLVAVEYNGVTDYKLLYFNSLLWFGIGSHGPVAWPTVLELLLSDIAGVDGTVTIQSLADHDTQIRADALTLTDKESNKLSEVIWNYVEDDDLDAATGEVKRTLETIAKTRMEQKQ